MFSKKVIAAAILSMGFGANAFASFTPLPENCEYGRDKNYDVSPYELYDAIRDGLDVYATGGTDLYAWNEFLNSLANVLDGFDYLRIETPKHVLKGETFRSKGNLFDIYAYVNFYNSEFGYVGRDKSNLDANSYLEMNFEDTYGYGLVWIERGGLCSAEGVWVQEAPKMNSATADDGGYHKISGTVNWSVDQYSRAAKDSGVKAKVSIRSRDDLFGTISSETFEVDGTSGTLHYEMMVTTGGLHNVTVQINDGTYTKTYPDTVFTFVTGPIVPPCTNCQAL